MLILDGKSTAAETRAALKEEIASLLPRAGRAPGLAVILAGDDPASQVYVRNKEKAALEVGMNARTVRLPASVSQNELEDVIAGLNAERDVDGILLQLPLPRGLDADACISRISPEKDVDGLTPHNQGLLALGRPGLQPCTPAGVMRLLDRYGISTSGKKAVVVGRSSLVGRPLALLLGSKGRDATVTMCHSRTANLAEECRSADILCTALWNPRFIGADMVKPGAVVVDVAMNRNEEGKLCGDVDFAAVAEKAAYITPVPGGVGPMTRAMLMENTVSASRRRQRKED